MYERLSRISFAQIYWRGLVNELGRVSTSKGFCTLSGPRVWGCLITALFFKVAWPGDSRQSIILAASQKQVRTAGQEHIEPACMTLKNC